MIAGSFWDNCAIRMSPIKYCVDTVSVRDQTYVIESLVNYSPALALELRLIHFAFNPGNCYVSNIGQCPKGS